MPASALEKIGFLVLAAGNSTRFGSNKLLATLPQSNTLVLQQTLARLPKERPVHVVCRRRTTTIQSLLKSLNIDHCQVDSKGMGASLAAGIKQTQAWHGWVICLADMPWIETESYRLIANTINGENIVVPYFEKAGGKVKGNPVGFSRCFLEQLLLQDGDEGARSIISAHKPLVKQITLKDEGILLDIDYPDDINRHQRRQLR